MNKLRKKIRIKNKEGLHARPAALFVQTASKFDSVVKIKNKEETVDGKSIMGILSLGAEAGDTITLIVEGEDAQEAIEELERVLDKNG
jgi:phosphotransferase system HPr (HPr) family protein